MKCPIDGAELVMTDRSGVEIDYCPKCRGVWLDRGELDKIVERSSVSAPHAPHTSRVRYEEPHLGKPYKKKKPTDFLGDLFDF